MIIRRETSTDAALVREVQRAAFGQDIEADLAAALRSGGHSIDELCFVAEIDGLIVGHVVCSRGAIDGRLSVGLGPIGVQPDLQHKGIGSALIHAVIGAADASGESEIALLGNPDYYSRFGFVDSSDVGITAPDASWGPFFQVRTLSSFNPVGGEFSYAAPFENLDD